MWRALHLGGMWLWWFLALFLFAAEYFFFAEYLARFNTVAIDYLHYWTEVAENIGEMYPARTMLTGAALDAAGVVAMVRKFAPLRAETRTAGGVGMFAAWSVAAVALVLSLKATGLRVSSERLCNELASNGLASGTVALLTRDLEYAAFFPTTDRAGAFARAREAAAGPGEVFDGPADSLQRRVPGDSILARPRTQGCETLAAVLRRDGPVSPLLPEPLALSGQPTSPRRLRVGASEGAGRHTSRRIPCGSWATTTEPSAQQPFAKANSPHRSRPASLNTGR